MSEQKELPIILSKYPVNQKTPIERESFPADRPEVPMMAALTYAALDTTGEFGSYEVTNAWGVLLLRACPRWIYAPEPVPTGVPGCPHTPKCLNSPYCQETR